MQRLFFLSTAFMTMVACSAPKKPDRNSPADEAAVIDTRPKAPVVQQASTAPKPLIIPDDPVKRLTAIMPLYAQVGAMMVYRDARTLAQIYAPDATLTLPDSTVHGAASVAQTLVAFANSKSLSDFQRQSTGMKVLDDSTLADSGIYVITMKRSPKDSVMERGRYAASVRFHQNTTSPVILSDRIMPTKAKGSRR